jgi:hypothetical protein
MRSVFRQKQRYGKAEDAAKVSFRFSSQDSAGQIGAGERQQETRGYFCCCSGGKPEVGGPLKTLFLNSADLPGFPIPEDS